ncbi:MAG: hypothetical protein ACRDVL_08015, partial [Acidimicrobiia bacterium]
MTDASQSYPRLRKQGPLIGLFVLLVALVSLLVGSFLLGVLDRPMVVQQPASPVVPDPPPIDPVDVPAEYREVIGELQELYALGRYVEVVELGLE